MQGHRHHTDGTDAARGSLSHPLVFCFCPPGFTKRCPRPTQTAAVLSRQRRSRFSRTSSAASRPRLLAKRNPFRSRRDSRPSKYSSATSTGSISAWYRLSLDTPSTVEIIPLAVVGLSEEPHRPSPSALPSRFRVHSASAQHHPRSSARMRGARLHRRRAVDFGRYTWTL